MPSRAPATATPESKDSTRCSRVASSADVAPVIVATRLRKGSANSARGAARLVADSLKTTRACGASATMIVRADSAYYGRELIAAAHRGGAHFSITARKDRAVTAAISTIADDAWTTIRYPQRGLRRAARAVDLRRRGRRDPFHRVRFQRTKHAVTARLIVRRVRDANPDHVVANEQGELFPVWRHHAVFTDSPLPMLQAEADHRRHAIIEQVIADLKNGPLAHLPSGNVHGERRVAGPRGDRVQPNEISRTFPLEGSVVAAAGGTALISTWLPFGQGDDALGETVRPPVAGSRTADGMSCPLRREHFH